MAVVSALAGGFVVLARPATTIDPSRLATVERGTLARSVVATGRIEPISKVEIKSKANGIIKELKVEEGDAVVEGQVLAELDKDNLAARAAPGTGRPRRGSREPEGGGGRVREEPCRGRGTGAWHSRSGTWTAPRSSRANDWSRQQTLDDARNAVDQAANRQLAARTQLGVSQARVAQARAAVAQATAAAEQAQEELTNATIRSPIRGIVLSRGVEIGSPVSSILNLGSAATLVMVLGDVGSVYVRGKVDETDIGWVRLDQPARIKVETFKDRTFEGRVTQIAPMGTERDNVVTFEVKVSIENQTGELKANMTANAEIVLEEHANTLIVPESVIVYDAKRNASVDVVTPDAKTGRQRVPIKIGISNGTRTEVLSGLTAGQTGRAPVSGQP